MFFVKLGAEGLVNPLTVQSPLHVACQKGHNDVISFLLQVNISILLFWCRSFLVVRLVTDSMIRAKMIWHCWVPCFGYSCSSEKVWLVSTEHVTCRTWENYFWHAFHTYIKKKKIRQTVFVYALTATRGRASSVINVAMVVTPLPEKKIYILAKNKINVE